MNVVLTILSEFWGVLSEMAPYLLFGFLVAGILSRFLSAATVERHLGGRGLRPVVKAAFLGVPLPLCSCSVLPVAASLRKHGASRGSTAAFLLSTPQTGLDSVFVTYSLLGFAFALFTPFATFATGLVGGLLVDRFGNGPNEGRLEEAKPCVDDCCVARNGAGKWARAFRHGFITLPRDIGKELLVGLVIAAAITAAVPDDLFAGALGPGLPQMLLMMAVGIPVYVCATASIPIAAALILKGITPGAALVFLMTGPATNAAALAALRKLLGTRSMILYLVSLAGMALLCGLLLDAVFRVAGIPAVQHPHEMIPPWLKTAAAVALLAVLFHALLPRRTNRSA